MFCLSSLHFLFLPAIIECPNTYPPHERVCSRSRRLSKDYERKVQTSETLIQIAMIRLLVTRLGRSI